MIERDRHIQMMCGVLHDAVQQKIERARRDDMDRYTRLRLRFTPLALVVKPGYVGVRVLSEQRPAHQPAPDRERPGHREDYRGCALASDPGEDEQKESGGKEGIEQVDELHRATVWRR